MALADVEQVLKADYANLGPLARGISNWFDDPRPTFGPPIPAAHTIYLREREDRLRHALEGIAAEWGVSLHTDYGDW